MTVTSGSTVERIAALVGPTRSSPAKKRVIAVDGRDDGQAERATPTRRR